MLAFLKKYFKRLGVKQKYIAEKRDFLNFRMAFLSPNCDFRKQFPKLSNISRRPFSVNPQTRGRSDSKRDPDI